MFGPESDKKMHVVGDTTDALGNAVVGLDDSAEICVELGTPLSLDYRGVILGSENQMVMQAQMG